MASAYQVDRTNARGQTRSPVYSRDRVQYNREGTQLLLGTWPAMTASETDAHIRWAVGEKGREPKGGPV